MVRFDCFPHLPNIELSPAATIPDASLLVRRLTVSTGFISSCFSVSPAKHRRWILVVIVRITEDPDL